jgi:hypothetical protein
VVHADEVVKVFAGATVEKKANKVDTAFPGFIAAFVDVRFDVRVLVSLACDPNGWR